MSKDNEGPPYLLTLSKDFLVGYERLFPFFDKSYRPYSLSSVSKMVSLENAGRLNFSTGWHNRPHEKIETGSPVFHKQRTDKRFSFSCLHRPQRGGRRKGNSFQCIPLMTNYVARIKVEGRKHDGKEAHLLV